MKIEFNVLDRQYKIYENEYNEAVLNTLKSGYYILGKEVEIFENNFSNFIGSKYCVGLNSGLDALILAFRALEIGKGDEVIVPANTYIASVLGITENLATPVFVEPDEFYNIDADKIEELITSKTKAILAVHLYGQVANIKKIKEICNKHNLFLIEDCAQSHGAKFDGKTSGTFGDIGCFSFFPTKNLGAFGDAGGIVTDDKAIYEKIKMLRNYGSKVKYYNEIQGINSRLDEIQAALLSVKLNHYNTLRDERETIARQYLKGIINNKIILPKIRKNSEHIWHLFVVRVEERDKFQNYLMNLGINTQIHYPVPPHLSEAYRYLNYNIGSMPITENFSRTVLSLPLYGGMRQEEIEYVIMRINEY